MGAVTEKATPRGCARPAGARARRQRRRSIAATALVAALAALLFTGPQGAAVEKREYALKAAFLFHLAQFVEWPPEGQPPRGRPFLIGVVTPDPFGGFLEELVRDATVSDRPVEVKYLSPISHEEAAACQIVFVPRAAGPAARPLVDRLQGEAVLLVGEEMSFLQQGGMVALVREADRVSISLRLQALRGADLHVSSRLLRLARIVDNHSLE